LAGTEKVHDAIMVQTLENRDSVRGRSLRSNGNGGAAPLTDPFHLGIELIKSLQCVNNKIDKQLKSTKLSHAQFLTLEILDRGKAENVDQTEIARQMGVSVSAVSGVVACLEKKGAILRKTNEHDKRRKVVVLTKKGDRLFEKARKEFSDLVSETLPKCPDEIVQLARDIERLKQIFGVTDRRSWTK
jgi:DNA-binding MarR family transcriptional regulator